jgi:hypothetical protein
MHRRTFLAGASTVAILGVVGCAGDDATDAPSATPTDTTAPTDTASPTTAPTSTATEASTRTSTNTPPQSPTGTPSSTATLEPSGDGIVNGGFENGLSGWTVGTDLPTRPGDSEPVDAAVTITTERVRSGSRAASLFLEGTADDGTIWVQQAVDLSGSDTLSMWVYSDQASFNTRVQVAAYAGRGPGKGVTESDFDTRTPADGHEGWKRFEYPVDHDGPGLVAVGANVVWETDVTSIVDDVSLS